MNRNPDIYDWTFASGRAAALEAQMLPASFFEQIVEMVELDDVYYSLTDTPMRDEFSGVEEMRDADPRINAFYGGMLDELRQFSPSPQVLDMLRLQKELRSLKNFAKRRYMELDIPRVESRYGDEVWERLWADQPTEAPPPFGQAVVRAREALASQPGRLEAFEAAFDGGCLRVLCDAAWLTDSSFVIEYYQRYDAVKGVELLWRARAMALDQEIERELVEGRHDAALFAALQQADREAWPSLLASAMPGLDTGGLTAAQESERIQVFRAAADAWLMAFAREAQYVAFGPERVFGCGVGLLAEADNLSLAIGGRANGIAPDLLRRRLRTCYV